MAEDKPTGIRARLEQLAARARDSLRLIDPGPEPGSSHWLAELAEDVGQAKRNETDRAYVVTRRLARVRRTSGEVRDAEILALAEIESVSGLPREALQRVRYVLERGAIPVSTASIVTGLIVRLADEAHARGAYAEGVELFEMALGSSDRDDLEDVSIALLCGLADLHLHADAFHDAEAGASEGLRRLGWGIAPDPYRGLNERRGCLTAFDQDAIVSLVTCLATCRGHAGAFDEASLQLADLRAFLQTGPVGQLYEQALATTEGWLDHLRGDYASAERKWGAAYDHAVALGQHEDAHGVAILIGLGWSYIRLGLVDQASGVAKVAAEIGERKQLDDRSMVRVYGLQAEVSLRKARVEEARRFAELGLARATSSPVMRGGGLRVLAECALAQGDDVQALSLAKEAVELVSGVLGDDQTVVDELLVLARAAAPSDRALAEATLKRAAAIPMPEDHPRRAEIERVRSMLLD